MHRITTFFFSYSTIFCYVKVNKLTALALSAIRSAVGEDNMRRLSDELFTEAPLPTPPILQEAENIVIPHIKQPMLPPKATSNTSTTNNCK